jgi:two-component system phosphate regulon sensor histidine kinase PhoR
VLTTALFRRLILPILLISVAAFALIAMTGVLSNRHELSESVSYAIIAGIAVVALALLGWVAVAYERRRQRAFASHFNQFIDANESSDLDEMIRATAAAISKRLWESDRDRAQLHTILSSMNDGLVAVDHEHRVLMSNRAAEQLLNVSNASQGKPVWEAMPPDAQPIVQSAAEVMLTARPQRLVLGPTEGRYLEVTLRRLISGEGSRLSGLIIVAHDITEVQQYQELRKEFVANVSHELRTPLTVIKGYAETLRDGALSDPAVARQHLAIIQKHADQLSHLVNDLLDLSRLESAAETPPRQSISVEPIIRRQVELMRPAAVIKRQHIALNLPGNGDHLPQILGHTEYLQRAIANLLDNAIKYTPQKGTIRVDARSTNDSLLIDVADNGIGIADDDLPRIFERFYRVDRSRSREMGGTGLGLSIVKHAVQSHGGTIDVRSEIGKGTTFTIRLPLRV